MKLSRSLGLCVVVAESLTFFYLTLLIVVACRLPVDDSVAFRLAEEGWWSLGVQRFALCIATSAGFSALAYLLNRVALKLSPRVCLATSLLGAATLGLVSLTACLRFVRVKPWF